MTKVSYDFGMRAMLVATLLLVAGCAQREPLQGIDLPPASMPDDIDSAQWAIAFAHDFGPGFWEQGPHAYQLFLDCPATDETSAESDVILFVAGSDVDTLDDPVHLRLAGLSTTALGPPNMKSVSTDQNTRALITAIGLSDEQVETAETCEGIVYWDDGKSAPLQPGEPFRP